MEIRGQVVNSANMSPVSSAHILTQKNSGGTISNIDGYFAVQLSEADSIRVSAIGFKEQHLFIPDSIVSAELPFVPIVLTPDTLNIDEVEIFPYDTYDVFKKKVISTRVPPPAYMNNPMFVQIDQWKAKAKLVDTSPHVDATGPIQLMYNMFSNKASTERKLKRNRRRMNRVLEKNGQETIPTLPEHMRPQPKTLEYPSAVPDSLKLLPQ